MPRAISDKDADCWIGVTDPKERKKIQDRLAQRARRKRLAKAKIDGTLIPTKRKKRLESEDPMCSCGFEILIANSDINMNILSIPDMALPKAWYSALHQNGLMMGLSCGQVIPARSNDFGTGIPEALRPTALQKATLHPIWIDRFPFPHMRDNFISLLGVVDPEDFLHDLFNIPSFRLEAGESWDPAVWRIEEAFRKKWGYLFDPKLLEFEMSPSDIGSE